MARSNVTGIATIGLILAGVFLYLRNQTQKANAYETDKEGISGGGNGSVGDPIPIDDASNAKTNPTATQDPISTIDPYGRYHTVNNYFDALLPTDLGRNAGRANPQRIAAIPTINQDTPVHARGAFAGSLNENANFFGSGTIAASRESAQAVIDSYKSRTSSGRTTGTSRNSSRATRYSSRDATRDNDNSQKIPSYYPSGFRSAGDSYGGFN